MSELSLSESALGDVMIVPVFNIPLVTPSSLEDRRGDSLGRHI